MAKKPARFTVPEIKRACKAVKESGLESWAFEIKTDGALRFEFGSTIAATGDEKWKEGIGKI